MKEQSIIEVGESRPVWESLERLARQGVQRLLQQLLEEEVEEAPWGAPGTNVVTGWTRRRSEYFRTYVKAGLEKDQAAMRVLIAALRDGARAKRGNEKPAA